MEPVVIYAHPARDADSIAHCFAEVKLFLSGNAQRPLTWHQRACDLSGRDDLDVDPLAVGAASNGVRGTANLAHLLA